MDYENGIAELEQIIAKLESGDVKFNEAISMFERGAELSKIIVKYFDETKGKITILREDLMGILKEEEF